MSLKCEQCAKELLPNEAAAKCVNCENACHPACAKSASGKIITKAKLKSWKCDSCKGDSGSVKSNEEDNFEDTKSILEAIANMKMDINSNTDRKVGEVADSIKSLKLDIQKLTEKYDDLERKHAAMEKRCEKLESVNADLSAELNGIREDNIDRDQRARSANIEIQGLPVSPNENIYYCLEKIACTLMIPYKREDISVAHRIRLFSKRLAHPPIVVQFVSRSNKEEWLVAARKKKGFNATEIVGNFTSSNIHINEHLSPHNKALLGRARRLHREKKLFFVGFFSGKVIIRPTEHSESVRVIYIEDLDRYDK